MTDLQTELLRTERGAIMALDSAADILPRDRGRDVLVTASYIGILPARLVHDHLPRAVIGFDGGVGRREPTSPACGTPRRSTFRRRRWTS